MYLLKVMIYNYNSQISIEEIFPGLQPTQPTNAKILADPKQSCDVNCSKLQTLPVSFSLRPLLLFRKRTFPQFCTPLGRRE